MKVTGKSDILQARSRLGVEPMQALYESLVAPIAERRTKGAWYRDWHLVSLDGSTLDVADTAENEESFGRPGVSRGPVPFPNFALLGCWKMERTCCGPRSWRLTLPMRSRWLRK